MASLASLNVAILVSGLVHVVLCYVRFVYNWDGNVTTRVLDLVLARPQVAVLLHPSCCVRSLIYRLREQIMFFTPLYALFVIA